MRMMYFFVVITVVAGFAPLPGKASQCLPEGRELSLLSRNARAAENVCISSPPDLRASGAAGVQLAQFAPGSCGIPGTNICVNGWIAVCQCYVYGCNYVPTAYRCGLNVKGHSRSKELSRHKAD